MLIDVHRSGATMHGRPMPRATQRHDSNLPPTRGENTLRNFHAVDIVGCGFFAHQNTGALAAAFTASSAVKTARPTAAPRCIDTICDLTSFLSDAGSNMGCSNWSSAWEQRAALLLLRNHAFVNHIPKSYAYGPQKPAALAVASLQHVKLAVFRW